MFSFSQQKRIFCSIKDASPRLEVKGWSQCSQCSAALPLVQRILTCFSFFPCCNFATSFTVCRCNGSLPELCNKLGQKRGPSKLHLLNPFRITFYAEIDFALLLLYFFVQNVLNLYSKLSYQFTGQKVKISLYKVS